MEKDLKRGVETGGETLNIGQIRFNIFSYGKRHTHDAPPTSSVRYIYIIEGALTFHVKDQEAVCARKHDIIYIPDGCHYVSDWQDDSQIFVADIGILDFVTSEHNYGDQVRILFHDRKAALMESISRLKEICSYSEPYLWMERVSIIMHILCEIAREQEEEENRHNLILQSVVFLNANYEKDTPVEKLAEMCSFSVSHYRRLFKEYYNMSPVDYRNQLRIRHAQMLLQSGSTVARAAEAVGIDDPGYFTRLYKKYTGRAPGSKKSEQS